ncbi:MAG: hypothetical protein NT027_04330 [Proteobacteria bacterium]|nr:hypothetical protein [Pseudomonadota bacterium]
MTWKAAAFFSFRSVENINFADEPWKVVPGDPGSHWLIGAGYDWGDTSG